MDRGDLPQEDLLQRIDVPHVDLDIFPGLEKRRVDERQVRVVQPERRHPRRFDARFDGQIGNGPSDICLEGKSVDPYIEIGGEVSIH